MVWAIVLVVVGGLLLGAVIKWPPWGVGDDLPPAPGLPTIASVKGKDVNTITLTWSIKTSAGYPILKFQVERTKLPDQIVDIFDVATSPSPVSIDDTGLAPYTLYRYRVRAVYQSGPDGWSGPKSNRTLPFIGSFGATLTGDSEDWSGYTLVQRIEAVRLNRSGKQVRLKLRSASTSSASIDRIYISQANPAAGSYESESDLKEFYGKVVIPANTSITLSDTQPDVHYDLDEGKPLLIAFDFSPGAPSGIRFRDAVPPEEASAYYLGGVVEAAHRPRSPGYTPDNRIYLIELIEVG